MKIVTWNVNSIRARLARTLAFLERERPDVLCVQETKVEDDKFPRADFEAAGWRVETHGQKTYNGVALLSRAEAKDVERGLPGDDGGSQRRLIAATFDGVRVVNVYVPNGESVESPKFPYKLEWLGKLANYLRERCDPASPALLCGDFNVAPEDRDVHDPDRWRGHVLFHPKEREALAAICALPLRDLLRLHHQEAGLHTWWDYRMGAFHRGWGLRIDLLLATPPLAARSLDVAIDREERKGTGASDHAPVVATFRDA